MTVWGLQQSQNIDALLDEETSDRIGREVVQGYTTDKQSRSDWEDRMENAIKLALQMVENKNYPWKNASNVKFPLITIAALQFSARSYPALVKGPDIVKYRVTGADPQGQKAARASRISQHMSYQLLEEDEEWEEEFDRKLIALPILGTVFKKTFFDPIKGRNCSRLVLPQNLIVNYYARSIEECERKTEYFELYDREVKERKLKGIYSDKDLGQAPSTHETKLRDQRQGITPPPSDSSRPRQLVEQHRYMDLDEDGYPEPYVVTVDLGSKKTVRIVSRFADVETEQNTQIKTLRDEQKSIALQVQAMMSSVQPPTGQEDERALEQIRQLEAKVQGLRERQAQLQAQITQLEQDNVQNPRVLKIHPLEHYTKYGFIPSPDGGFYELGMGALLGPLNDSVNTLINQLIDSGTLQNGSQGFIGKGARIKGGKVRFEPFEWKRVNVAGSTLKESMVPLPINSPSPVLFNTLSLLISYSERVASINDAMSGQNPGQNTPAYSYHAMLEQGLQVFNGIFKRIYRSFRKELKKVYVLNRTYLNPIEYFETLDGPAQVLQLDYSGDEKDVYPAADPNAFSNMENVMKAHFLAERSAQVPGYHTPSVERRLLESMDIPDVQQIYPVDEEGQPQIQPPPNPEVEVKMAEEQRRTVESQARMSINAAEAESKIDVNESQILLNQAKAQEIDEKTLIEKFDAITKRMAERREAIQAALEADNETSNSGSD